MNCCYKIDAQRYGSYKFEFTFGDCTLCLILLLLLFRFLESCCCCFWWWWWWWIRSDNTWLMHGFAPWFFLRLWRFINHLLTYLLTYLMSFLTTVFPVHIVRIFTQMAIHELCAFLAFSDLIIRHCLNNVWYILENKIIIIIIRRQRRRW